MNGVVHVGVAFIIAALAGKALIPALHKLKFGQAIREEGPQDHLKKAGTPTMGGLIFMLGVAAAAVVSGNVDVPAAFVLVSMAAFGLLGFADDYLKVVKKHNLGLRAWQKLTGQLAFSVLLSVWAGHLFGTAISLPFTNWVMDLGLLFYPFFILVTVATTNAVNLTDGLDGLSSSITILVSAFFAYVATAQSLHGVAMVAYALVGGLIGFLLYNRYPAKVFMGDLGSLAMGGAVTGFAFATGWALLIPIVGLIYFVETLSVVIQVVVFKKTGKRVFKMSPIHHHFELSGWSEVKIVSVFIAVTAIACMIGLLAIR